jgi:hypothetical protein
MQSHHLNGEQQQGCACAAACWGSVQAIAAWLSCCAFANACWGTVWTVDAAAAASAAAAAMLIVLCSSRVKWVVQFVCGCKNV